MLSNLATPCNTSSGFQRRTSFASELGIHLTNVQRLSRRQRRLLARFETAAARCSAHQSRRAHSTGRQPASPLPDSEPSCSHSGDDESSFLGLDGHAHAAALLGAAVGSLALAFLAAPGPAVAGESLPFELVNAWLEEIEALGSYGAAAFVLTVITAELIPLFPTQPLALAGGLLFGPVKGGALVWGATCVAALAAFLLSRNVGGDLIRRLVSNELEEAGASLESLDSLDSAGACTGSGDVGSSSNGSHGSGSGKPQNPIEAQLSKVYAAVESGGFKQQLFAILMLRLLPVVPFSAGNYLLGLSPLPLAPFMVGSAAGMLFWSFTYASVGGASRALLLRGASVEELFADMSEKVAGLTEGAAAVGIGAVGVAAAAWAVSAAVRSGGAGDGSEQVQQRGGGGGGAGVNSSGQQQQGQVVEEPVPTRLD